MVRLSPARLTADDAPESARSAPPQAIAFDAVYQQHARYLWRAACRLGVSTAGAEDVVQDVFLIVHRRLHEFVERTSIRAWLFAILVRVVRDHRRTLRRKGAGFANGIDPDGCTDTRAPSPLEAAERAEAVQELYELLDGLEDDHRELFVLIELEQLTVPEAAQALQMNVNTAYWRLRLARRAFEQLLARRRNDLTRRPHGKA